MDGLLGPGEYAIGVQEIVAAVGTVDASIISVDGTLAAGFAAGTAATAAAATAVSTTVAAEAASTRDAIVPILNNILAMQRIVSAPVGVEVRLFRFSTRTVVTFSRRLSGPGLDNTVYYGLTIDATMGSNVSIRFDPFRNDTYELAGPRIGELVYFTIGTNPSSLAVFLPN